MQKSKGQMCIHDTILYVYAQKGVDVPWAMMREDAFPGLSVHGTPHKSKAHIRFKHSNNLPSEAYRLVVKPKYILVEASGKSGFVYALQTLCQLRIENTNSEEELLCLTSHKHNMPLVWQCVKIEDSPRTMWRGFMLDSGRQYQSVATIKKCISMVSMLKMNVFHWHLTEGLGWRVEIENYPRLTQVGAFVGKREEQQGYYTQQEIKQLVHYAQERGVNIVPEIDMPGHAEAALASYPELGCFNLPVEIPRTGFTKNIFCAGKEHTIRVLKNILDEVCRMFPSAYIHLGGDEAPKGNWDVCPDCQKRISEYGLKNSEELQLHFSAEMANYLKEKGRKAIFWGDIIHKTSAPLPDNVVIQWWNYRGHKDLALRKALEMEVPVVCSSNYYNYLNFPVTPWRGYKKNRTFGLRDVYEANPSYKSTLLSNPLVMGITCALWTDDGVTEKMITLRLFPRILAIAEQMWHKGQLIPFARFHERVAQKQYWFEKQGFKFGEGMSTGYK